MSIRKYWLVVVAFIMILSLTSCNNNEPQIVLNRPTGLSCSVPTYDNGATIRWNAVPSATGYIIYIDDVEVARANKNAYAFAYEDSDIFCGKNCTVQAYDDNGGISLVSNILIIPNKAPITVSKVNFYFNVVKNVDNTMLIEWQNVNAIKYEIYIGDEKIGDSELEDQEVIIGIRPEGFEVNSEGTGDLTIDIEQVEYIGRDKSIVGKNVGSENPTFRFIIDADIENIVPGRQIKATIKKNKCFVFDKITESRIQ